jgi:hypothetical protein
MFDRGLKLTLRAVRRQIAAMLKAELLAEVAY